MNTLDQICTEKKAHIARMKQEKTLADLQSEIKNSPQKKEFKSRLLYFSASNNIALIAEVKKASPSRGVIRDDFDPVEIARIYQDNGAACLSVLTDVPYFRGSDDYLRQIRKAVDIPILRKDFMLDPYQIYESKALGADCILLIMAALDDLQAKELYDTALSLGLDALIEVHDSRELERALALGPAMIGVNSRNLKTLEVNLETAMTLAKECPPGILTVAESGIDKNEDIRQLQTAGYQAFLVGESLMKQYDIGAAVQNLLGLN